MLSPSRVSARLPAHDHGEADELLLRLQSLSAEAQIGVLRSMGREMLQAALDCPSSGSNRRSTARKKVLRTGKVIYNNKSCVVDCQVRDLSDTGCRIRVASSASLPRHFQIAILGTDRTRECEAMWRTAGEVGVQFLT